MLSNNIRPIDQCTQNSRPMKSRRMGPCEVRIDWRRLTVNEGLKAFRRHFDFLATALAVVLLSLVAGGAAQAVSVLLARTR